MINTLANLKTALLFTWYTLWHCLRAIYCGYFHANKKRICAKNISTNWSKKVMNLVKAKFTVHNPYNIQYEQNKKYIIMCNHTSFYDIPLSILALPDFNMRMIAKKELTRIPFFGPALKVLEFPIVDRSNKEKAKKTLLYAQKILNSGISIWICPEGTRSKDGSILPLKRGGFTIALETGATIIPIYIKGANQILSPNSLKFNINVHIDVYIGKPIIPENINSNTEFKDLIPYIENVKQQWMKFGQNA